ncbi:transglutaminaseTgpA domain-containing protein [Amycolatopsis anabasis]|uniref:transglutaminase family protein n=1 Tax=Amycolatopsis anabasis TaxID=1840409 RepID=UPI00131B57BF|nr:transglutaminase domain-containing protein [Amycolatopsis anabasis]
MNQHAGARAAQGAVLAAAVLPGLLFAPVFGISALLLPLAVVAVACLAANELAARVAALAPWRPVLALALGLLGLAETVLHGTTRAGLPTGATVRALVSGVTDSWQLTLQSTWPARPEASLLLFVPLAVLVVAIIGVELLRWPLFALLPSLALLGLSQAYVALSGPLATVAGLVFFAIAGTLLAVTCRRRPAGRRAVVLGLVSAVLLGVGAAAAVTAVDKGNQPAYSLHQNDSVPVPPASVTNPLDEIAARLDTPGTPVFSYTASAPVDRWRLVVLDGFDGVSWQATARYRRLGTALGPDPSMTVPTAEHTARVALPPAAGPWLPSQAAPASVTGIAPLIDPASGMLLRPDRAGPLDYGLTWREPRVDPGALQDAAMDPQAATGGLGVVPPGIDELARTAVAGLRPSFRAALVLERFLSEHYQVATGADLPTGAGWPQLRKFLLGSKRGTSEQFAAAYVALARIVGIPARLAVGFRAPAPGPDGTATVRDGDVLAWPEVAVAGVGWVPLDPTGAAGASGAAPVGLAAATAQARAELPPPPDLIDPPLPRADDSAPDSDSDRPRLVWLVLSVLIGLLVLALAAAASVPVTKLLRTRRRRRRIGTEGVVAAWREARDLLRAHGVPCVPGATVRDLAASASPVVHQSVVDGLIWLAGQVDIALWSGDEADDGTLRQAWGAVAAIRRGLADRPRTARLRAALDPRGLLFAREPALSRA